MGPGDDGRGQKEIICFYFALEINLIFLWQFITNSWALNTKY